MISNHHLLPHHKKELCEGSGLSEKQLHLNQVHSATKHEEVAAIMGYGSAKAVKGLGSVIVYPYVNREGHVDYHRIKPDRPRVNKSTKRPIRYLGPRGRGNEPYIPHDTRAVIDDTSCKLIITEGEKKALKCDQEGFPCVGISGVWCWKNGDSEQMLPALQRIPWNGRRVFIAFDSDVTEKDDVLQAECRLAVQLKLRGAIVRVVRLPAGENGEKVGIDDFFVARGKSGAGDFRKLIEEADEPDPVDPSLTRQPAKDLDPCDEAEKFINLYVIDGRPRLVFWKGTFWYWSKGRYAEWSDEKVRGKLIAFLNEHSFKLTTSITNNIIDQLKAQVMVPWGIDPPAWFDEVEPWPADEVFSARNGICHLPSIIDGVTPNRIGLTPKFFSTTAVDYDIPLGDLPPPDAWIKFLNQLWPDDQQSIEALQEWFGYLLTADTRQHKILMLVGPKRAGKGTICRVQRELLGRENIAGPTLASLSTNFGLWPLVGKSLAIVSDARLTGRTNKAAIVERLLSISGEDLLTIDRKNREPIHVQLPTRLMLVSNELPSLTDASGALASRMILLRLTQSWYGQEDTELTHKLLEELPSIAIWAIFGLERLRERGRFVQPDTSLELIEELEEISSPIMAFVKERCDRGPDYDVVRADLYDAYVQWAEARGRTFKLEQGEFGKQLFAACPEVRPHRPRRQDAIRRRPTTYGGIKLKTEF